MLTRREKGKGGLCGEGSESDLLFPFPCFLAAFLLFFVSVSPPSNYSLFFFAPLNIILPPILVLILPLLSRNHIFRPLLKWAQNLRHRPNSHFPIPTLSQGPAW